MFRSLLRRLALPAAAGLLCTVVQAAEVSFSVKVPELDGVGRPGDLVFPNGTSCEMGYYEDTCSLPVTWQSGNPYTVLFDAGARSIIGRGAAGSTTVAMTVGSRQLQLLSSPRSSNGVVRTISATKVGLPVSGTIAPTGSADCTPPAGATSCVISVTWSTQNGGQPVVKDVATGEVLASGVNGTIPVIVPASSQRTVAIYAFTSHQTPIAGGQLTLTAHDPLTVTGTLQALDGIVCSPAPGANYCNLRLSWTTQGGGQPTLKDTTTNEVVGSGASGTISVRVNADATRGIAIYPQPGSAAPIDGTTVTLRGASPSTDTGVVYGTSAAQCVPNYGQSTCQVSVYWNATATAAVLRDTESGALLSSTRSATINVDIPAGGYRSLAIYRTSTEQSPLAYTEAVFYSYPTLPPNATIYPQNSTTLNRCLMIEPATSCTISIYSNSSVAGASVRDVDTGATLSGTGVTAIAVTTAGRRVALYSTATGSAERISQVLELFADSAAASSHGSLTSSDNFYCRPVGYSSCNITVFPFIDGVTNLLIKDVDSGATLATGVSGGNYSIAMTEATTKTVALFNAAAPTVEIPNTRRTLVADSAVPNGSIGGFAYGSASGGASYGNKRPSNFWCMPSAGSSSCSVTIYWSGGVGAGAQLRDLDTGAVLATSTGTTQEAMATSVSVSENSTRRVGVYANASASQPIQGLVRSVSAGDAAKFYGSISFSTEEYFPLKSDVAVSKTVNYTVSGLGGGTQLRDMATQEVLGSSANATGSFVVTFQPDSVREIGVYSLALGRFIENLSMRVTVVPAGSSAPQAHGRITTTSCSISVGASSCSVAYNYKFTSALAQQATLYLRSADGQVSSGSVSQSASTSYRFVELYNTNLGTYRVGLYTTASGASGLIPGTEQDLSVTSIEKASYGPLLTTGGEQYGTWVKSTGSASCRAYFGAGGCSLNVSVYNQPGASIVDLDSGQVVSLTNNASNFVQLSLSPGTTKRYGVRHGGVTIAASETQFSATTEDSRALAGLFSSNSLFCRPAAGSNSCVVTLQSNNGTGQTLALKDVDTGVTIPSLNVEVTAGTTRRVAYYMGATKVTDDVVLAAGGSTPRAYRLYDAGGSADELCFYSPGASSCTKNLSFNASGASAFTIRDVSTNQILVSSGTSMSLVIPAETARTIAFFDAEGQKVADTDLTVTAYRANWRMGFMHSASYVCNTGAAQSSCSKTITVKSASGAGVLKTWNGNSWTTVNAAIGNNGTFTATAPAGGDALYALFAHASDSEPIPGTETLFYSTPAP